MPTRLEVLKIYYGCRHDGETVLKAASSGEFTALSSLGDLVSDRGNLAYICSPVETMLREIGIEPEMERQEVIKILQDNRNLKDKGGLKEFIEQEVQSIPSVVHKLPDSIPVLPGASNKEAIITTARNRIVGIINEVISFCQDDTEE